MILVNGDSFTAGEESPIAWPSLITGTENIATPGASNDHILMSTMEYVFRMQFGTLPEYAIIAWTSPNRIDISGKHLTPTSGAKYGSDLVDAVFKDWDETWARKKFLYQTHLLGIFLRRYEIPYVYVSSFDIQTWAPETSLDNWLGWPKEGIVEWMGDCPKGPGGHPLELGHQRIAKKINEHIRNLGWIS
jgi:hypothetical protein